MVSKFFRLSKCLVSTCYVPAVVLETASEEKRPNRALERMTF